MNHLAESQGTQEATRKQPYVGRHADDALRVVAKCTDRTSHVGAMRIIVERVTVRLEKVIANVIVDQTCTTKVKLR